MVQATTTTRSIKGHEIERLWHLVDMDGKVLGRQITQIATHLQGKNKRNYVPYLDCGDHVVVINASKLEVTGKKWEQKEYDRYSGFPGGRKTITLGQAMDRDPQKVVRAAVSGMLPKNKLRDVRLARLHIFEGKEHPYTDKFKTQ